MNSKLTAILLLGLLPGCTNSQIETGEVAAHTQGYIFMDNFGKGCGGGGLITVIDADTYLATNPVPVALEGNSSTPLPVWIRYEPVSVDTCVQSTNRIKILSIRKQE